MEEDTAEDSGAPPPAAGGAGHGRGGRGPCLRCGIGSLALKSTLGEGLVAVGVGRGRGAGRPVPKNPIGSSKKTKKMVIVMCFFDVTIHCLMP
jgi:hypothetical protein